MEKKPLRSKLNTKSAHILLMVVVKDLIVLHGSGNKVVKQKLSFLIISVIAVLAESEKRPSQNASESDMTQR